MKSEINLVKSSCQFLMVCCIMLKKN